MEQRAQLRRDFVIKDLVISIPSAGGRGGTFLPADDTVDLPPWISPIAGVLVKGDILEVVRGTMREALRDGDFTAIGSAFREGDPDGNPAIQAAIFEIGSIVVASAAFAEIARGGSVGLVDPDCGGTSFETIPPTITPIVHVGMEVHRVSELPRLRKQLAVAVQTLDRLATAQEPRGPEVAAVREQLEGALRSLG
jgi:hypothetical protein